MPEDKVQISLRLPSNIVERFDALSGHLDRDRSWLMVRALKRYLEEEGADILDEAEGMVELDQGLGSDLDEVMRRAREIVTETATGNIRRTG
ncbi:ribbon-helix-helix protein, CopG family [Georhizobium profundi]|uniref:Ribbon-helix-helix protein, CopG family n=1 Tax=Georhizobium profundi TaxID=2341112 RepID=A0A3Q8XRJ7_9HYPH|nr:ribbon-helix-helix domain-containing protein [Georhizobium profundi]AZN73624.1 ribbon-helix-helix protein, CopG family [Georhizobium profundi]